MRDRIAIIDINTKKFKAISYKQYDENNILQIVVLENGIIKGLSNYITTVRFQLPSGKIYKINGTIENNTIKVVLTSAILNEYGKVIVELELANDTQIITTFSMYLNIEKSINKELSHDPDSIPDINDKLHTHKNKEILDKITQEMINSILEFEELLELDIYATKDYVQSEIEKIDINTDNIDLSNYAKKEDLDTKADKTELFSKDYNDLINKPNIPSLDGYATENYVKNEIANAQLSGEDNKVDLSGYATKDDLNGKADKTDIPTKVSQLENDSNYLTSIPEEYITETELNAKGYLTNIPKEYITDEELNNKGYLTEHQDLSNYPTKDELSDAIESVDVSEQLKDFATKEEVSKNTNDINKILEIIDEPPTYVNPTLTISSSSANIQHNTQTNVILTPRFTQNDAGSIISYSLSKDGKVLYTNTTTSAYTDAITLQHGGSTTYTATVNYGDGIIKNTLLGIEYPSTSIKEGNISNNVTIRGYALSYYGVIESDSISGTNGLSNVLRTSKGSTLTFNMTNQRVVYMYPKSFGNLTSIKDANNFDYINSYTLTNMTLNNVEYNVYILTDAVTINGFKQIFN